MSRAGCPTGGLGLWGHLFSRSGLPIFPLDLFLGILAQLAPVNSRWGSATRVVAGLGGRLVRYDSFAVGSSELCGIRRTPPAVSLLVRMSILKAASPPLTSITQWKEGVVVRIGTLPYSRACSQSPLARDSLHEGHVVLSGFAALGSRPRPGVPAGAGGATVLGTIEYAG